MLSPDSAVRPQHGRVFWRVFFMRNTLRLGVFGLLVAAGFLLAPAAFARGHLNVGVNIGLPGLSLGYRDCHHCGWGGGYAYAAPTYYGPTYYEPAYYEPAYYPAYPAYGAVYYSDYGHYRNGGHDRYRSRGHDGYHGNHGRRASYYDRGGYRHH